MKKFLFLILIAHLMLIIGCSEPSKLKNSFESPEDLGKAVVSALNVKDGESLHRYRVDEEEYIGYMWYSFPASQPKYNIPEDFAWDNLNIKCIKGVTKWVNQYGDRDLEFQKIEFVNPTEKYDGFSLLRGTVLHVKTNDGKEKTLHILGSVVEMDGRYKLLSYDDG